jgi:hypothetical protein
MFVEMFEMEIVEKKGTSCRRLMGNIYLQNPAWVFRGNVVSHMGCHKTPKKSLLVVLIDVLFHASFTEG